MSMAPPRDPSIQANTVWSEELHQQSSPNSLPSSFGQEYSRLSTPTPLRVSVSCLPIRFQLVCSYIPPICTQASRRAIDRHGNSAKNGDLLMSSANYRMYEFSLTHGHPLIICMQSWDLHIRPLYYLYLYGSTKTTSSKN
jgi:hypothetical protein